MISGYILEKKGKTTSKNQERRENRSALVHCRFLLVGRTIRKQQRDIVYEVYGMCEENDFSVCETARPSPSNPVCK